MAVSFVNAGTESATSAANLTLNAPASPVTGDIWIAVVHTSDQNAHSFTDWTQISQANGGGTTSRLSVWYFRYAGSNPNLVVTHTIGATAIGGIAAFRGCVSAGSPVDTTGATSAGTDASIEVTGFTPTAADTMLVICDGAADDNNRSTLPTSFTACFEDTGGGTQNCYVATIGNPDGSVAAHYRIWTTGATGNFTDTQAAADPWASVMFALKPEVQTTKTQTALARITDQVTKTQTALARITVQTTKTQTALARITDQVSQTQSALARITDTVDKTQTALARITVTTTKTQTAVANITTGTTTSQTQTAIARITDTQDKTQTALARITDQISQTQTAIGRITDQVSQTQTALARITDQVTQTQSALARITVQTTKTQSAIGRITDQVSQTQSAVGRITDQVTKTQTAIGNILIQQLKTQTALARIHATTTKTQTAVARIGAIAPSRPISGLTSYHWYLEGQWMGSQPDGKVDDATAARIAQGDHRYMQKE